jgi:hypothetical protein
MRKMGWNQSRLAFVMLAAVSMGVAGCGSPSDAPPAESSGQASSANKGTRGPTGVILDEGAINPPDVIVDPDTVAHLQIGESEPGGENAADPSLEIVPEPLSEADLSGVEVAEGMPVPTGDGPLELPPNGDILMPEPTASEPIADAAATVEANAGDEPASLLGADLQTEPQTHEDWPQPQVVLVISGQQHGYIEPCGCTGLDRQKGGMMRRATFLKQLSERGWEVVPMDAGNQVRSTGPQAAIKFQTSVKGLTQMGYRVVGFGPDDLRLGASELLSVAASDGDKGSLFASSNIELLAPDLVPTLQRIDAGGRKIGVTTALDPSTLDSPIDDAIVIGELQKMLTGSLQQLKDQGAEFNVLLLFGTADAARGIAAKVPGYDLIVAASTVGEPTYQAELIEGTSSRMIVTGDKGMYVGVIGLFADEPFRYSRVALTAEYDDAPEIQSLMAEYQDQLKTLGLEGLKIEPIAHPSGREFVGAKVCGECHTTAYAIWEGTPHALATEHIVHPGERSEVPRHFDPECLACHVTGWNTERYYPYTSGYLSLEKSPLMTGNGCENCHGPGKSHADAERKGSGLSAEEIQSLRKAVTLTMEKAREKCLECHDLDNSPDFHLDGAFEEYWSQVEHYGVE